MLLANYRYVHRRIFKECPDFGHYVLATYLVHYLSDPL